MVPETTESVGFRACVLHLTRCFLVVVYVGDFLCAGDTASKQLVVVHFTREEKHELTKIILCTNYQHEARCLDKVLRWTLEGSEWRVTPSMWAYESITEFANLDWRRRRQRETLLLRWEPLDRRCN